MKQLATVLHSLFCHLDHLNKMEEIGIKKDDPTVCFFHLEQVFETPWEMRDHGLWLENASNLSASLDTSPAEALKTLNRLLSIIKLAAPLIEERPELKPLLLELMENI